MVEYDYHDSEMKDTFTVETKCMCSRPFKSKRALDSICKMKREEYFNVQFHNDICKNNEEHEGAQEQVRRSEG